MLGKFIRMLKKFSSRPPCSYTRRLPQKCCTAAEVEPSSSEMIAIEVLPVSSVNPPDREQGLALVSKEGGVLGVLARSGTGLSWGAAY